MRAVWRRSRAAKAQSNHTDPESRIMRTSTEGYQQCYNAQAAVDGDGQLVVGTPVMDNASDQGRLPEMFDVVDGVSGEMPGQVLAGKARRPRRSTQRRPG